MLLIGYSSDSFARRPLWEDGLGTSVALYVRCHLMVYFFRLSVSIFMVGLTRGLTDSSDMALVTVLVRVHDTWSNTRGTHLLTGHFLNVHEGTARV